MSTESAVRIAMLLPDLLGTYGDRGNATVLAARLHWRGLAAEILEVPSDSPVPLGCDIYLLGGGEDVAQAEATRLLRASAFPAVASQGSTVFAVCAGLQILGGTTVDASGAHQEGLGLLDLTTRPGRHRSIGEVTGCADPALGLADPVLTGFENHAGITERGPETRPLARVTSGTGNGDGTEGAVRGRIFATYLHGPVLARNPALADHLLRTATGIELAPVHLPDLAALRRDTVSAAKGGRRRKIRSALLPSAWHTPGVTAGDRRSRPL